MHLGSKHKNFWEFAKTTKHSLLIIMQNILYIIIKVWLVQILMRSFPNI